MRWCAILLMIAVPYGSALSQQDVKFPAAPSTRIANTGEVEAVFTLPPNAGQKVPAVVIIHTRGGYNAGHSELYAAPLRQIGIATLDVILSRYSLRAHPPSDFVPHAFGALKYLLSHPRIDSSRIGIMGMSLGGILAIYTASEILASEHLGGTPVRYVAHAGLYPVCNIHERVIRGQQKRLLNAYDKFTGAPVLLLAGGKDQYDDPDSCQQFIAALPAVAKSHFSLIYYADATHGWDQGRNNRVYTPSACKGRGCDVDYVSDLVTTGKARESVVDFFASKLVVSQKNQK